MALPTRALSDKVLLVETRDYLLGELITGNQTVPPSSFYASIELVDVLIPVELLDPTRVLIVDHTITHQGTVPPGGVNGGSMGMLGIIRPLTKLTAAGPETTYAVISSPVWFLGWSSLRSETWRLADDQGNHIVAPFNLTVTLVFECLMSRTAGYQ